MTRQRGRRDRHELVALGGFGKNLAMTLREGRRGAAFYNRYWRCNADGRCKRLGTHNSAINAASRQLQFRNLYGKRKLWAQAREIAVYQWRPPGTLRILKPCVPLKN